ncbi:unnamed protein product [Zymoseptoria tritici ST99CH_3D7]|uniref:Uncharacterized protein n=1 Tax=Zymoseptoria tritici (strain ST99CH_3D7) TaxID=1276538 RepID=A0A1X7RQ03_ZYMT9|nr:unnamed protein product [Zymoseptoria tritici ST99CH_3D7]
MKLFAAVTFLSLLAGALAENKCAGDPNGYGTCTINGVTKPCIDEPCDDKADGECVFDGYATTSERWTFRDASWLSWINSASTTCC